MWLVTSSTWSGTGSKWNIITRVSDSDPGFSREKNIRSKLDQIRIRPFLEGRIRFGSTPPGSTNLDSTSFLRYSSTHSAVKRSTPSHETSSVRASSWWTPCCAPWIISAWLHENVSLMIRIFILAPGGPEPLQDAQRKKLTKQKKIGTV